MFKEYIEIKYLYTGAWRCKIIDDDFEVILDNNYPAVGGVAVLFSVIDIYSEKKIASN